MLWARTHLIEGRAGGSTESLQLGLERAAAVCERNRSHFDAAVTLAELEIEMARATGDGARLGDALDRLARARQLRGCHNRIGFLEAQARLERARLALAAPQPDRAAARADLEAVVAMRDHEWTRVADNAPWLALISDAEAALAKL